LQSLVIGSDMTQVGNFLIGRGVNIDYQLLHVYAYIPNPNHCHTPTGFKRVTLNNALDLLGYQTTIRLLDSYRTIIIII